MVNAIQRFFANQIKFFFKLDQRSDKSICIFFYNQAIINVIRSPYKPLAYGASLNKSFVITTTLYYIRYADAPLSWRTTPSRTINHTSCDANALNNSKSKFVVYLFFSSKKMIHQLYDACTSQWLWNT